MSGVPEFFGCDVFDGRVMKSVLSMDIFDRLNQTIYEGRQLDIGIANERESMHGQDSCIRFRRSV